MDFKGQEESIARLPSEGKQSRRSHVARFHGMLKNPTSMKRDTS
jgi:hypothetical protein